MRLLARLVLALVVVLSVPMTLSACHTAPVAGAVMTHAADHHQPTPKSSQDLCVGCIAPVTVHPARLAGRIVAPPLPPQERLLPFRVGAATSPATPPPRLG